MAKVNRGSINFKKTAVIFRDFYPLDVYIDTAMAVHFVTVEEHTS